MKFIAKKKDINIQFWGGLIAICLVGILTLFLFNKGFPTAEGWYSYYAKSILNGDIVYTDFEYLFTPVYMYLITGIIKVFGYNLLVLRIFGVIIYCLLTLIIFLTLNKVFSVSASVIGAVTGVYYLQSEVYTVFYDYVRVMDIFAYLSAYFMLLTILDWQQHKTRTFKVFFWGLFTSLFFLVKQNMGGLFLVYSILFILFSCFFFSWKIRQFLLILTKYLMSFAIPVVLLGIVLWKANVLNSMIDSVFFGAMEAKGGIITILFRWITNNYESFLQVLLWGILAIIVLFINRKLSIAYPQRKGNHVLFPLFTGGMVIFLLYVIFNEDYGTYLASMKRLDVTLLFIVSVVLLFGFVGIAIYQIIAGKSRSTLILPIIALLGTYFSLCYGAGMSGGLSIGESALGLATIICILFDSFQYKFSVLIRGGIAIYCMYLCCCCMAFKIVYPCNWWGIDDSNIYEATETTDIPLLKGIKVSKRTKDMYEGIVNTIKDNTSKDDKIFCFPHIPIFYLLCDRDDPGVYTKVQWFDVSTRNGIESDIELLQNNLPAAFIVYNLNDGTYKGHEEGFFAGKESATRELRNEIYTLVNKYEYTYQGTFLADSNNISVFTLNHRNKEKLFAQGDGSKDNPYIISTADDLINFAMQVNQGNTFEGVYFKQSNDIDLSNNIWVPIGYIEGSTFNGYYDSNGFTINNVNCSSMNSDTPFGNEIFVEH